MKEKLDIPTFENILSQWVPFSLQEISDDNKIDQKSTITLEKTLDDNKIDQKSTITLARIPETTTKTSTIHDTPFPTIQDQSVSDTATVETCEIPEKPKFIIKLKAPKLFKPCESDSKFIIKLPKIEFEQQTPPKSRYHFA